MTRLNNRMKRLTVLVLAFLLLDTGSLSFAGAIDMDNENAQSIAEQIIFVLETDDGLKASGENAVMTLQDAQRIMNAIRDAGITGLQAFEEATQAQSGGTIYTYEWIQDLLEVPLGSYYGWSIENKHRFDLLMVQLGQLEQCINLLPEEEGVISEEEALAIASSALADRFQVTPAILKEYTVNPFFSNMEVQTDVWQKRCRFGFEALSGYDSSYSVELDTAGNIVLCESYNDRAIDAAERYYSRLLEEKGAFFTWSLEDKASFAKSFPTMFTQQQIQESQYCQELLAILDMGFCLPTPEAISSAEALALAVTATQQCCQLDDGWADAFSVYFSFFQRADGTCVWRVIFWGSQLGDYQGGLVELDAATGTVLDVKKNGGTYDTSISVLDRL